MRLWSPVAPQRRLRLAAASLAFLAIGTTAGCANASPSVAAYVDGTPITSAQLDAAVAGVGKTVEQGQQVSAQAVLNALVHGVIADQIAAKNGIVVTDAERGAALQGSNLEPLLPIPAAAEVAYDVADQQIVAQKIGAQPYLDQVAQQKVTLNPRYGVLDEKQKLIVGDESGSLAEPASPSPTPTP
jgi:hypothetical protein